MYNPKDNPKLKHLLLHTFYLEGNYRFHDPYSEDFLKAKINASKKISKYHEELIKANRHQLFMADEIEWINSIDPSTLRELPYVRITPKGEDSFVNRKYIIERNSFIISRLKDYLGIATGIIGISTAVIAALVAVTSVSKNKSQIEKIENKVDKIQLQNKGEMKSKSPVDSLPSKHG
jgi:hypothetical protein